MRERPAACVPGWRPISTTSISAKLREAFGRRAWSGFGSRQSVTAGRSPVVPWAANPRADDPPKPPSFDAFTVDGALVNLGSDGASVGSSDAARSRTATFTIAVVEQETRSRVVVIIRVRRKPDEPGELTNGSRSFTLAAVDAPDVMAAEGEQAYATRSNAEPLRAGGQTLPELLT